ncbi:unnamed protein product [Polarella glacialis]|uniref:Uncharacterized protein n=1 Tax=Polarella glacialis TaxID=89957 RepID=A0A813INL4_POLGL|nr:unnamed protein product [Polarella glacialis]
MQQSCCQARRLAEHATAHNGRPSLLLLLGASRQFLAQPFLSIPVMQHVRPAFFAFTGSQPWSKNRRPRSCVCRQVACLATTTTAAAGQSAETLLGAMSGVKLPLLAADVAGHDMAPFGCSLSLRQGQGQARLAARRSFLANLAVEVTLQQTGATSASGATYALVQCHQPAEPRVMAILGGVLQQQQQEQEQPQHVVFALGSAPFVPDPACCLRALPPRPAEISLGARLLLLPLRTSSFPLCKPVAPWQQRPLMPTSLFAGLCLLGSATRLLDSSCAQQAPCERRLWAQMSKVRVVCKIPGAHLGRPRILMWPGRTCRHVGAEEARPKDNTNNDNNDLYAGLASMLVQRCRAPGYSRRQVQCNLPAQVQGGCPCAMDAALLDGAPSEHPWQVSAKVAGSGAKSCATSSCTSQVKHTQDLLQAALRTYIPAFMCRKRGQTSRRSLLQAARRTRCTADGPAPGSAPGRLLPIPPQSSQQLVCLGRARDAALLCRMASLPACRLQTLISLKCCSNAVARVTTCCSTQALQIAAPLWAQQIPPVSQFRFAEPKVQKQVQKQAAAAAAVGVVCQALPLVAVFGAATSSHDAALLGFSSPCRS